MTCLNRGSRSPTALEKLGGRNCTNRVAPRPLSPPPSPQPRRSGARTSPWWNPTEWRPSRPETVAGSTPWWIAWLAQPCRRSCSRIFGNSACLERRSNCLVIRAGWISLASGQLNTRSSGRTAPRPSRMRSSACFRRCSFNAATVALSSVIRRTPAHDFGSLFTTSSPAWTIVRSIEMTLASRSTQPHRKPTISPRRHPVTTKSTHIAKSRCSRTWVRNRCTSLIDQTM